MTEARTTLRAFAVVGVAVERSGDPESWVNVKKVVYTREAAVDAIERLGKKDPTHRYFMLATNIEPLGCR